MDSTLRVFVKSRKVTIESSDLTWGGNNCRQPMGTGKDNKSGKASGIYPVDHLILLDAVARATNETGTTFEIVDIGVWGFLKKLKKKGSSKTPRIEYNGGVLEGTPTAREIVEFITMNN
ncbi:MAG: hypothetical protein ACFFES_10815 [Candidatus Thorarchaeota archaeon]